MILTEGTSETQARHEVPVLASLGLRAAAVTDLFASLARLLSPVLDVLIRLWLAEDFLVADVMEHMLGDQAIMRDHPPPSASLFAGLAATGFGIFVQTICPVLLAAGLFTRFAALALLLQVLVLQMPCPQPPRGRMFWLRFRRFCTSHINTAVERRLEFGMGAQQSIWPGGARDSESRPSQSYITPATTRRTRASRSF